MRRLIYLARHGETSWNREGRWQGWTDIPLNDAGEAQAFALAEQLRGLGVSRIVTSSLCRARRTAEIVAEALSVAALEIDPDLRERGFGLFEGLTREECEAHHPLEWSSYRADTKLPPGAEPFEMVTDRMFRAVRRAADGQLTMNGETGAVLVVSHGSAIRAFVRQVTGQMPPPLVNTALFRAVALADGFEQVELL